MLAINTTSLRRIQWAGLGYLFVYVASEWRPNGLFGTVVLAVCGVALAVQLIRTAGAGLRGSTAAIRHPVQSGKPGLRNRNRSALEPFAGLPDSRSQAVGLGS